MIVLHPSRMMDFQPSTAEHIVSEFERDVMRVMNVMERQMQDRMNYYLGSFGGLGGGFSSFDDFFKGPLSGFEEIHRPCPMAIMRNVDIRPVVLPSVEESVEKEREENEKSDTQSASEEATYADDVSPNVEDSNEVKPDVPSSSEEETSHDVPNLESKEDSTVF